MEEHGEEGEGKECYCITFPLFESFNEGGEGNGGLWLILQSPPIQHICTPPILGFLEGFLNIQTGEGEVIFLPSILFPFLTSHSLVIFLFLLFTTSKHNFYCCNYLSGLERQEVLEGSNQISQLTMLLCSYFSYMLYYKSHIFNAYQGTISISMFCTVQPFTCPDPLCSDLPPYTAFLPVVYFNSFL